VWSGGSSATAAARGPAGVCRSNRKFSCQVVWIAGAEPAVDPNHADNPRRHLAVCKEGRADQAAGEEI